MLLHDPWLLSLISWIPALIYFTLWLIFSAGIARELPIGVVDLDNSRISRTLIRHYNASPALNVSHNFPDVRQGSHALRAGKINGLVIIPMGLEKQTVLGHPPKITAFVNNQFLLIGKSINSALLQSQGTFTASVEVVKNLASGPPVISKALSSSLPIGSQFTPLFNISTNYAQFLTSALLPAVWQIFIVAVTVLSFAAETRRNGLQQWLQQGAIKVVTAKFVPLTLVFWLHGQLFLWAMVVLLDWPMNGSWIFLGFIQLITVCASIGAASIFYFLTRDAARGLSMAAAYVAPGLAFMGVTFPITDMTLPAKIWRSLLPVSHYMEVQIAQMNYGAPLHTSIPQLKYLVLFIIPLLFTFFKARQLGMIDSRRGGK